MLGKLLDLCSLPGRYVGWLVVPIALTVCMTLIAAQTGTNSFWDWEGRVFIMGDGITVNTMLDLQWYFFAMIVLFGGALGFRDNSHVSVDFLSAHFSDNARHVIRILGDLLFLLPFCLIMCWYGYKFALTAFNSGEGSSYGGLMDRWVIKACLPIGFGLLALSALARAMTSLLALLGYKAPEDSDG